jgi:hypothetical protein
LTFSDTVFGQTDTVKYNQFGDSLEFGELNLNPDNTFEFHHYNIRSCWTWYSVYGIWKRDNENIVFIDTIHWQEDNLRIDTSVNNTDFVLITVKSDKGKPLQGIEVKYNLFWADKPNTYVTDKNGEIKINKTIIGKQKRKEFDNNQVQLAIYYSNKKSSECSEHFFSICL